MTTVPNFALYGTQAQPSWGELVNFERIPERSALFDWEIAAHVHDALLQLLYLVRGGGTASLDGAQWHLQAPCLILVPAGTVHGFHFAPDTDGPVVTVAQRPLEALATSASPQLLAPLRQPLVLRVDPSDRQTGSLMPLFEAIEREARSHQPGQLGAGMSLVVALLVHIARMRHSPLADLQQTRSRKAVQIERFRGFLDRHFREHLPLQAYAQALGVSAGQLNRLCRHMLGMSTLAAVNARLLHEARRDLVYSSLSIKQLAAELGFEDDAYFGRFFKKQTGQRPSEFREMARQQLRTAPGS